MIRKLIQIVGVLVLMIAIPALRAETADDFLKAYFLIQDGDAADKGGETAKSVEKYTAALKILSEIKKASPDWNPNIIAYRVKYCADHITKGGGKVETEASAPSAAEAAAPSPTVEVTTPINTVPSNIKPAAAEEVPTKGAERVETPSKGSERVAGLERELQKARQEIERMQKEKGDLEARLKRAEDDLRTANAAKDDRLQALMQENTALKARLSETEAKLRNVGSSAGEIASVKDELAKTQAALEKAQKDNEELRAANDALKKDLEETRGQLKTANASPASTIAPEVLQTLQKENALLRSIVDRQFAEDSRRTAAKDALSKDLDELGARAESIRSQIKVLQTPLTPLSEDEKQLLKTPAAAVLHPGENDPAKLSAVITSKRHVAEGEDPAAKLTGDNAVLASDAKRLFAKGDLDGAADKYEQILKSDPNNLFALSNLGVIRFRQDRIDLAEKALQSALAVDPQDAFSLSVLGIVNYRQGRYDDAISALTRSLSLNPNNYETHNYLGITYSQKGYQEAAEKELLKAIELRPDYADAHFNLAVVFASENPPSTELARTHYKKALELGMAKDPELDKLLAR